MTDLNHVVLIGRLTRDLGDDERSFGYVGNNGNGTARANVSIAVNRSKKSGDKWEDETSFFDITIWGNQAVNLKPYLKKGKMIAVDGYLKQDRWEKDGQKMSKISIVANNVQLLGGNGGPGSGNGFNNGFNNGSNGEYSQTAGGAPSFQPVNNSGSGFNNYNDGYSQNNSSFGNSNGNSNGNFNGPSYGSSDGFFQEDIPF